MRAATACVLALSLALFAGLAPTAGQKPQAPGVVPAPAKSPAAEKKAFRLPPGFEAQLVAAEPDIHKPMNLAFDDRGRLWVTDTVEYPFPAPPGKKGRDTVKVLSDFGPDGRARKVTTFADGLNIPIGLLPLPAAEPQDALVHSIPNVWRLRDSKGTGQADERKVLYSRYGFRDTHGMTNAFTWGFDGWVYACHGFANDSTVQGADGNSLSMNSGNTYRLRADGARVEPFTFGQVNPFGLSFDPLGNLYSADCHSQPIYQLLRGAYYPSFAKGHDGLGFGPAMITKYKGSTAVAGVVYYAADHFPPAYRGHAFVGDVMTNEVLLFQLSWTGSTPRAKPATFLASDDQWFRPVDLKLGPDGALYVADFYNCIIGHYEVPLKHPDRDRTRGRIWRIVYKGKDGAGTPAPRPDWTEAPVAELVKDLKHPNFTVRVKASNQLAERGGKAGAKAVREAIDFGKAEDASAFLRAHGLWVLERTGALDEATLEKGLNDKVALVRVHAQRVLSERGKLTGAQHKLALAGLKDADAHVRRAAADALGRHPSADNVRPLLALLHAVPAGDTHLRHVARMALRDQLRKPEAWKWVAAHVKSADERRAVADVALGVPSAESAHYLVGHLKALPADFDFGALTRFVHHVARHGDKDDAEALLAFAKAHEPKRPGRQAALLRALERGATERGARPGAGVRAWAADLTPKLLASKEGREVQAGIELVGLLKLEAQQAKVVALALARATPEGQRAAALTALTALDGAKHAEVLGKVLADAAAPVGLREHAAGLLAKANRPATRATLVAALATAPARLQTAIAANLAGTPEGAEQLLAAVEAGKASARLLQERVVALRLEAAKVKGLSTRLEKLTAGLPAPEKKLAALLAARRKGYLAAKADPAPGAKVFEKHCAVCHQLGGKGAKVGPQLDGVGGRGLDRLLEDTLDPNRNIDQAFRLTTLTLKKGGLVSGLFLREEGAVYVVADAQGKEVRVPIKNVEDRASSPISPMPANFDEAIPEKEFHQLMTYLLSQKAAKPEKE